MVSFRYYLDTRKAPRKQDSRWPLKMALTKRGDTALLPVGVYLLRTEWDADGQRVTRPHPQRVSINNYLDRLRMRVEDLLRDLVLTGEGAPMTATQVRDYIAGKTSDAEGGVLLADYYAKVRDEKHGSTRDHFVRAWELFVKIDPRFESVLLAGLDVQMVQRLDAELTKRVAMTTRNTYIAKLMLVCKRAHGEGLIHANPCRDVRLHYVTPRHRALTLEQMRTFLAAPTRGVLEERAMALFKLSFYLRAINTADIARNGPECISNGRIRYVRAKTGKLYDFRLEPEAVELLDKWCGTRCIFAPFEALENPEVYARTYMDDVLRRIAGREGLPPVTMYWARHTFTSLIIDLGYSIEMASLAMGHGPGGLRVTAGYVTIQERRVDAIVRDVYDAVAGKEKGTK